MVRIYTAVLLAAFSDVLFYTDGRNYFVFIIKKIVDLTEVDEMRKRGFSLIEVLIAMGILTIIATVAVPKVQVWNARNRGLQSVMELISDFSKAKSVAGYTVAVSSDSGTITIPAGGTDTMNIYMGIRRQTAMVFGKSEYAIYQKDSMDTTSWDNTALLLKKNVLLDTVTLEYVNKKTTAASVSNFDGSTILNFTSTGKIKDINGTLIDSSQSDGTCGPGVPARYLQKILFSVILRSRISKGENDSIWYRVDIDQRGEYSVCTVFSSEEQASAVKDKFASDGIMLDI